MSLGGPKFPKEYNPKTDKTDQNKEEKNSYRIIKHMRENKRQHPNKREKLSRSLK